MLRGPAREPERVRTRIEERSMFEMKTSREVNAPPARVFAVATDLRRAPDFMRAITKLEVLTEGPVRAGTRFRETRKMFGKEATEEMEILSLDAPKSYTVGCDNHGCRYRTEIRVEPRGQGSELSMTFRAEPLTFMAKAMGFMMKPLAKKMMAECGKDLDDIAKRAEMR
jgi:uncharacterized protein YndB with AHSA1/START domain